MGLDHTGDIELKGGYAMADITMKQAQAILKAALNKAEEIDTKMDIAIVDTGANLKAVVLVRSGAAEKP